MADGGSQTLVEHARGAAAGDRRAFQAWVEAVTPTLYAVAFRTLGHRADAEDVVQETVVRAWQGFAELRDPAASLGWACTIARSASIDRGRQKSRRVVESWDGDEDGHADALERQGNEAESVDSVIDRKRARAAVREAIETLPEKHRTALLLRESDGLSNEEIAAALGVPLGTVESRLHRARHALGRKLATVAGKFGWRTP